MSETHEPFAEERDSSASGQPRRIDPSHLRYCGQVGPYMLGFELLAF